MKYGARILSKMLKYAEHRKDVELADWIKRIRPASFNLDNIENRAIG